MTPARRALPRILLLPIACLLLGTTPPDAFNGTWVLDAERSASIAPWTRLTLTIDAAPDRIALTRTWSASRGIRTVDAMTIPTDGARHAVSMAPWPDNPHIGVSLASDSTKHVSARWLDDGRTLQTSTHLRVRTSQDTRRLRSHREYRLSPDGEVLTVLELRSTRPQAIRYTFRRDRAG